MFETEGSQHWENDFPTIMNENLLSVGYEESVTFKEEGLKRYISVPNEFKNLNIKTPEGIDLLQEDENTKLKEIPLDSISISMFNLDQKEIPNTKYKGVISNLVSKIKQIQDENPQLTELLQNKNLSIEDILIISLEQTKIYLLI